MNSNLKRPTLHSTSSDTDIPLDSNVEAQAKRSKVEQINEVNNESSPKICYQIWPYLL